MENITQCIVHYAEKMLKDIEKVKTIAIPQPETKLIHDIQQYTKKHCNDDFSKMGTNIIYSITADELPFNRDDIEAEFELIKADYKEKGKDYHVSHINKETHWKNKQGNYVLYVGSAESNAKGRFIQHLGFNKSRSTYALYLKDWWPENHNLTITYYSFENLIKDDDHDSLQIIEDALWEVYKPLFGKKGGRNL